MDLKRICQTIESGIEAIKKEQSFGGGFSSWSTSSDSHSIKYETTFFAANILSCLNAAEPFAFDYALATPECALMGTLIAIQKTAAQFLVAEKSSHWSFNYWALAAAERKTMPYPDDLDDTFVALAALYGYDPKLLTGGALASIAKLLTAAEIEPGGPYRTWLVAATDAGDLWRDIDIVVNGNVGYFLSRFGVVLPNLTKYIDERILAGDVSSPYYPGMIQSTYFLSRFYKGALQNDLADILFSELGNDGIWRNPLESAMAISALINLGFGEKISERDMARFMRQIDREGYRPYAFCVDPARGGKKYYAGSSSLTAAFCVEALAKYATISPPGIKRNRKEYASGNEIPEPALGRITALAQKRAEVLPEHLRSVVSGEIEKITAEEIIAVPFLVRAALGFPKIIPQELLDELALANLYGWIAYTICDDFLDGEGEPLLLSAANYFLRELAAIYAALDARIPEIGKQFSKTMNAIDDANVLEQLCRPVALENLADRSLGHALPALAVFAMAGYALDSRESGAILSFFKNYLIARQMHDDAHDWKEDLLRGQANSAGARLLGRWKLEYRLEYKSEVPCNFIDMPHLQKLFWHTVIPEIVADIKHFLNKARREISTLEIAGVLKNSKLFEAMIGRLESAADRTAKERNETVDFLAAYQA